MISNMSTTQSESLYVIDLALYRKSTSNDCDFSETYLDNYIAQNWKSLENCVGGYQIESEGLRLFQHIEGDYFSILGMPLLEIVNFLAVRGVIEK